MGGRTAGNDIIPPSPFFYKGSNVSRSSVAGSALPRAPERKPLAIFCRPKKLGTGWYRLTDFTLRPRRRFYERRRLLVAPPRQSPRRTTHGCNRRESRELVVEMPTESSRREINLPCNFDARGRQRIGGESMVPVGTHANVDPHNI